VVDNQVHCLDFLGKLHVSWIERLHNLSLVYLLYIFPPRKRSDFRATKGGLSQCSVADHAADKFVCKQLSARRLNRQLSISWAATEGMPFTNLLGKGKYAWQCRFAPTAHLTVDCPQS